MSQMQHAECVCDPTTGAEGGMDIPDKDYEDDGGDSKSLRLTLMEEVLLLGLKDREVCGLGCGPVSCWHSETYLLNKRHLCINEIKQCSHPAAIH